jgi:hypothetical protein
MMDSINIVRKKIKCCTMLEKNREALDLSDNIKKNLIHLSGPESEITLDSTIDKAAILAISGKYNEALSVFNNVLDTCKRIFGVDNSITQRAINLKIKYKIN